jgi:hypothetical protein
MKQFIIITTCIVAMGKLNAQDNSINNLEDFKTKLSLLSDFVEKNKFKTVANLILNDPQLYNQVWNKVYGSLRDEKNLAPLKNLMIEFKTFQLQDSNKTSLGFSYAWNYDINKARNADYTRSSFVANANVSGNVAFKKENNPNDFQEAKLSLGQIGFLGGIVRKADSTQARKLNTIRQQLAGIDNKDELKNSPLWEELTTAMGISNHYHYAINANGGWEGTQDFSKSQVTFGMQGRLSAKAYANTNLLARLNILDYPFALIRYLIGTDKNLEPYGAALPLITLGIDRVKPEKDSARKQLLNDANAFTRFRFETTFRTLIADIDNMPLHFNAAFRFFKELNAPTIIRNANLDSFHYFTCSVTGNNTYFISYSYGKLPFDRNNNAVYAMGFKLNL